MGHTSLLLLLTFAVAWYNVGTIWAHEMDIFRSWTLVPQEVFPQIQARHWKMLPYWVFLPVGLALTGSVVLLWRSPAGTPRWALTGNAACQGLSLVLTFALWGPWQAALSRDVRGPKSPFLARILATHWIRTGLITLGALLLLEAVSVDMHRDNMPSRLRVVESAGRASGPISFLLRARRAQTRVGCDIRRPRRFPNGPSLLAPLTNGSDNVVHALHRSIS